MNSMDDPLRDLTARLPAGILDDYRVVETLESLRRDGTHISVVGEVHEWDGASATVTTHLSCIVNGRRVEGGGATRDRGSASVQAILAAVSLARADEMASLSR